MKVEELIEQLKQYSKDATIGIWDCFNQKDLELYTVEPYEDGNAVYFNVSKI